MMKRVTLFVVLLAVLSVAGAGAEEKFGVQVYPGAKYDDVTSKALKEAMQFEAACYRTSDPVVKVAEFYKKQGLSSMGDVTKEGAFFKKGKIDVTVQTPWMNMKTGAMMKDTLISIVRQKE